MKTCKQSRCYLAILSAVTLTGCAMFHQSSSRYATSLVQFLYPKGMEQPDTPRVPTLSLPLKVGIAWVPEHKSGPNRPTAGPISENQKAELLHRIIPHFQTNAFVKSIEIIPSVYLRPEGGFANLDQLRTLHGVDVMSLVSYDQMQFTSEGVLSLAYWTVVGAYVVQGEKNDTQTLLDTAVYDISSRRLLFRAPGTSRIKGSSTPVNLDEELRRDSERGFQEAATNMVANLQTELTRFRERVKQSPEEFKIVRKPGYTGAGAVGWTEAMLASLLGATAIWWWRTSRP